MAGLLKGKTVARRTSLLTVVEEALASSEGERAALPSAPADLIVSLVKAWKGSPEPAGASRAALVYLVQIVLNEKVETTSQVTAGAAYGAALEGDATSSSLPADVEEASGVGQAPSEEELTEALSSFLGEEAFVKRTVAQLVTVLKKVKGVLRPNYSGVLADFKCLFPFADMKLLVAVVRREHTAAVSALDADAHAQFEAEVTTAATQESDEAAEDDDEFAHARTELEAAMDRLPNPWDNSHNSPEAVAAQMERTKRMFITRFPPEPNGHIHLGHAKAMNLSFSLAKRSGGRTYLRFDDTNPMKESIEYVGAIREMVEWLGHTPYKVTHSAHYFDQMFELCKQLISQGDAYACACSKTTMEETRRNHVGCEHRDRDPTQSLQIFNDMAAGKYEEKEVVIRMRQDMQSTNGAMLDHACYRVLKVPHHVSGDKWCVYPTYDFEHCLVDALEDVSHSLCTIEFRGRRESYYWLLEKLGMWKPHVWEFSPLNISHSMMSKRRLLALVEQGLVDGWDDPRLLTLVGLRRRGVSAEAIKAFCDAIGVTDTEGQVSMLRFEHAIRKDCDSRAARTLAVLDPVVVHLSNFDEATEEQLGSLLKETSLFPSNPECTEKRPVYHAADVVIDAADMKRYDLESGRLFRLRYGPVVRLSGTRPEGAAARGDGDDGSEAGMSRAAYTAEIVWSADAWSALSRKEQVYVHWAAVPYCMSPEKADQTLSVEVREYSYLFGDLENPTSALKDGAVLEDMVQPASKRILKNVVVGMDMVGAGTSPVLPPVHTRFQFERIGYYVVDKDSTATHLVLNSIVTLREDRGSAR